MNITARRNAYGRQLGSFETNAEFSGIGEIPMTFIRAPYIDSVGEKAEILSTVNGKIIAAKQDRQLVTAFHPELTGSTAVHKYFIDNMVKQKRRKIKQTRMKCLLYFDINPEEFQKNIQRQDFQNFYLQTERL